jgi:hypothetical protein
MEIPCTTTDYIREYPIDEDHHVAMGGDHSQAIEQFLGHEDLCMTAWSAHLSTDHLQ